MEEEEEVAIATWIARVGWNERGKEGVGVERRVRKVILNIGIGWNLKKKKKINGCGEHFWRCYYKLPAYKYLL